MRDRADHVQRTVALSGRFYEAEMVQDLSGRLAPGEKLRLVKMVSYGWSSTRSRPALRDQVAAALAVAMGTGWEGMLAEQRAYLDDFWDRADVELDGDDEIQQAVRFALFHILQASARAERQGIPAKGLTGSGYDGHAFWDSESFVLPVLTCTVPHAAADALRWRGRASSGCAAAPFRGGPFTARNARATGRRAPRPSM